MAKICPRCGAPYSWMERRRVGNRFYIYAVHVEGKGRNRKRRSCYLGPEGSYSYVTLTHPFPLRGLGDRDRLLRYLEEMARSVWEMDLEGLGKERVRRLGDLLVEVGERLRRAAEEL